MGAGWFVLPGVCRGTGSPQGGTDWGGGHRRNAPGAWQKRQMKPLHLCYAGDSPTSCPAQAGFVVPSPHSHPLAAAPFEALSCN